MQISVDTDALRRESERVRLQKSEIEGVLSSLELLIMSLGSEWQGDAQVAYASRIVYIKREYAGLISFLDSFSELLDCAADDYEELDLSIVNEIDRL